MRRWRGILLLAVVLAQGTSSGCNEECPPGEYLFACANTSTEMAFCQSSCADGGMPSGENICAVNENDAEIRIRQKYPAWPKKTTYCYNLRGAPVGHFDEGDPGYAIQTTPPSCDPDPADDACVTCAKASCCSQYQACADDDNCVCLVGCVAGGGTVDACLQTCGAATSASTSTALCLNAACSAQCVNGMGSMAGNCACGSSSSSTGSGQPSCTPGPTGSGEPCFSDGDCASCVCDPQTMICG